MLKADLHIHTKEDHIDKIRYTAKDLVNYAAKLNFKVLAITNHYSVYYNKDIVRYAKKKGILLIPGIETRIKSKEVLLLNARKLVKLKDFSELEKLKKENVVVIAPHAFYPRYFCLRKKLLENIKYFDLVEYCHFYLNPLNNYNQKAVEVARRYKKPLIGNSDAHHLYQINNTYSLIDADMKIDSVLEALRKGKIKIETNPLSYFIFSRILFWSVVNTLKKKISGKDKYLF